MKIKLFKLNFFKKIKSIFTGFYRSKELKLIFENLEKNRKGKEEVAMFVGGCVRNFLKDEKIDDIDLATSLSPQEIKKNFENTKFEILETGIDHGSITIKGKEKNYEITTLRKDIKTDGRHALIEFSKDWKEDSERRDFTINAIYLNKKGKIYDPQLGVKDLKNNVVKFIGDPEKRIQEDYLRILRFVRFSIKYNHKPEESTIKSIRLNINGITNVSRERILVELKKILYLKNFIDICKEQKLKEIFEIIFQEFKYFVRIEKLLKFEKNLEFSDVFLIALLTIDLKKNHEYFIHKYKTSNNLSKKLNLIAANFENLNKDDYFFNKDLKKNIYFLGKEIMTILYLLQQTDKKKIKNLDLLKTVQNFEIPHFPYDGNFLIQKGFKEGKDLGAALKEMESKWVNQNFKIDMKEIKVILEKFKPA